MDTTGKSDLKARILKARKDKKRASKQAAKERIKMAKAKRERSIIESVADAIMEQLDTSAK